jgi:uncharacterized membrane protein
MVASNSTLNEKIFREMTMRFRVLALLAILVVVGPTTLHALANPAQQAEVSVGILAPEPAPAAPAVAPTSAAVDAQECQSCGRYNAGNTGRYVSPKALVTPLPTLDAAAMQLLEQPGKPVVKAVMFWMSTCPHCHEVIDEVLPPLRARYGAQFQIELIELGASDADERLDLFYRAAEAHGIEPDFAGVPFLLIGDRGLMGVDQIRAELPGLIEQHLAAGGVDFPQITGLAPLLPAGAPAAEACAPSTPCAEETALPAADAPVPAEPESIPDPATPRSNGFTLAIFIMAGMGAALIYTFVRLLQGSSRVQAGSRPAWLAWATPILALIGLGVAGYLSYVETQAVQAVCGPVGDCNAVQASPYARLFGILPVGVLGAVGYIAILAAWLWGRLGRGRLADLAPLAVFGAALFGVLFSLYLTYLEPFVIGAVCAWCLTSAVIITLLLLLAIDPALVALGSGDEGVVAVGEIEVEQLRQGES